MAEAAERINWLSCSRDCVGAGDPNQVQSGMASRVPRQSMRIKRIIMLKSSSPSGTLGRATHIGDMTNLEIFCACHGIAWGSTRNRIVFLIGSGWGLGFLGSFLVEIPAIGTVVPSHLAGSRISGLWLWSNKGWVCTQLPRLPTFPAKIVGTTDDPLACKTFPRRLCLFAHLG